MAPPGPIVWKGIAVGESGRRYDVDQDLNCIPSTPEIARDDSGHVVRAFGSQKQLTAITKSMEQKGRKFGPPVVERVQYDLRDFRLMHSVDDDIRRLGVKMSVATVQRVGIPLPLGSIARSYLIDARTATVCPVRITVDQYPELDTYRPKVGHLVYVRASRAERRIYSVVQFFGVIQFYCELNDAWAGEDHGVSATHDPVTHEEDFRLVPSVDFSLPALHVQHDVFWQRQQVLLNRVRLELVELYGDQAPLALTVNPEVA